MIYSKAIDHGAILYRDVWDIKQPAIFVFYLVAGKLFGFTEIGVHLFEIIYWFGLSLVLIVGLRKYFTNQFFAAVTPLLTIGIYYSVSGSLHLTQAESLVCFPLFMSLWFCQKFLERPNKKSFLVLSGLFGGIVVTFKLVFVLILFAFWSCLFVYCYFWFSKTDTKQALSWVGLILTGLLIPVVLVIVYFAVNGAVYDLWYTTFVYPYNAVMTITTMENRDQFLRNGLVWFFKSYFPAISLSLVLLILNLKSLFDQRHHRKIYLLRPENFFFFGLFIWCFFGLTVILIQRLSWWEYHYSLLMLPLGILAARGVEKLLEEIRTITRPNFKAPAYITMTLLIMILFVPTARRLAHKIGQSNEVELIKIGNREFAVTGGAAGDYKTISADTAFLRNEDPKAPIFIVSNPLYYYLSDSPPILSSNGAMSDMFTDFEWERLSREMSERAPKYIFIEARFIRPIGERYPAFIATLNNNYSIYATGSRGSFYKLND